MERFDLVVQMLDGPLAGMGPQTLRGPVVHAGTDGHLRLKQYRGVEARHATMTVYDGGQASITPVGTAQVRVAPHPHVDWNQLDPIREATWMSRGCAVHLGPPARGATFQLLEVRRLAEWDAGPVQGALPVHRSRTIAATAVPGAMIGCMVLVAAVAIGISGGMMIGAFQPTVTYGVIDDGEEYYQSVDLARADDLPEPIVEGLQRPFRQFVATPSARRARDVGALYEHIDRPATWDGRFFDYVTASIAAHARNRAVFRRLETIKGAYADTLTRIRKAELPEVLAAVPYQESRYKPEEQSPLCAKGYWQLMPEVAHRHKLTVRDCRLSRSGGEDQLWSPVDLAPPRPSTDAVYVGDRGDKDWFCRIEGCADDDRTDLERSTRASIVDFRRAWDDPVTQASGAAVAITILSHHAGFDDTEYGGRRRSNLKWAFEAWAADKPAIEHHRFYGDSIRCGRHDDKTWCGSPLPASTQHYAYNIVAQHILAVCYYGTHHASTPAFQSWASLVDASCENFELPSPGEL